jgi:integrase
MNLNDKRTLYLNPTEIQNSKKLKYPWSNEVWDLSNTDYDIYNPKGVNLVCTLSFSLLENDTIKNEFKVFLFERISQKIITAASIEDKFKLFQSLIIFVSENHPNLKTLTNMNFKKTIIEIRDYCLAKNYSKTKIKYIVKAFNQVYEYWLKIYDTRDEYEKDVWDIRNINPSKVAPVQSKFHLNFTGVPKQYKQIVKKYLKVCLQRYSLGYCEKKLYSLRVFLTYISQKYNDWNELNKLSRNDIEDFIVWAQDWFKNRGCKKLDFEIWNIMVDLKAFIEYIQLAEYTEAPKKLVNMLIFREDKPRKPDWRLNAKKYIPQEVLDQLEDNIQYLDNAYIPVVIVLRATGLRVCDVLTLQYSKCLELVNNGWYVVADISKTKVINHRIPITEEVAFIIKQQSELAKQLFHDGKNPNQYLFVRESGARNGLPPDSRSLERALNKLAKDKNIVDDNGDIFHFKNHAFRHTKAVELINNGMNLLHVQKWLAHFSPEMTLRYAQLLDTTLRKSWEQVMKSGLFRVSINDGNLEKIEISSENNDLIEWEYIRKNLDAVRIPLGYCFKPNKVQCTHQLNPCLTCSNMCTSPEFAHEFEIEIEETKKQIERAKQFGRTVWIEKNEAVLERLQAILTVLKEGKVYHKAGKQKREYTGDEKND